MRTLVVEDDFISRRLLCRYLETYGECLVALDGAEALAEVRFALERNEYFDLICLDIMMPGLSGHEVLSQIRELEEDNDLGPDQVARIIMTTAREDKESVEQAFAATADGYVNKPIDRRGFLAILAGLGLVEEAGV